MAFVPDINGVCSIDGTLEMTSMPTKMARTKIKMMSGMLGSIGFIAQSLMLNFDWLFSPHPDPLPGGEGTAIGCFQFFGSRPRESSRLPFSKPAQVSPSPRGRGSG